MRKFISTSLQNDHLASRLFSILFYLKHCKTIINASLEISYLFHIPMMPLKAAIAKKLHTKEMIVHFSNLKFFYSSSKIGRMMALFFIRKVSAGKFQI